MGKSSSGIVEYLDQLTFEYAQLCQRDNGSVYGIATGRKCRKGRPISTRPEVKESKSKTVKSTSPKSKGKEAKGEAGSGDDDKLQLTEDPNTKFMVPKSPEGYDIQKDIDKPGDTLGGGGMGWVDLSKGPPPGVLKKGKLGQYEAEVLARLQDTGVAPDFHGAQFIPPFSTRVVDFSFGAHVLQQEGYLAMSKMGGRPLTKVAARIKSDSKKDALEMSLVRARKTIHQNGIAHNDMHPGNIFIKPNGSTGFIDFGLSQVGYRFALIEAMGSATGQDWQFDRLYSGNKIFRQDSPARTRLRDNEQRARQYLMSLGVNWGNLGFLQIRTKKEIVDESDLGNLSDDQIKKALDILYEGF